MVGTENLKVLILSSEVAPYAKTGGLGDVAGSLPKALVSAGVDVRVVMPKYKSIKEKHFEHVRFLGTIDTRLSWRNQKAGILVKETKFPTYFIENDYYFGREGLYGYPDDNERFAFFCRAALNMLPLIDFYPDVIHCNDWQTGLACMFLKHNYKKLTYYSKIKTLFTIHNLQYQGIFSEDTMEMLDCPEQCFTINGCEYYGQVSYMKAGLNFADRISTVSNTYSDEIKTPEYGYGLDGLLIQKSNILSGIINGIDYNSNNPEIDTKIYKNFSIDSIDDKKVNKNFLQKELGLPVKDCPVISIVSRLADQKGIDLVMQAADIILSEDIQLVILGTGESRYEYMFRQLQNKYSDKVSANIFFDETLAQKIYAGSDIFLMPSLFEPCGLGQIFSLRYGTIPVVRKTGGLADTITHYNYKTKEGNGFVFENYDAKGLVWGLNEALKVYNMGGDYWNDLVKNAMRCDFSWNHAADEYIKLYNSMIYYK